MNSFLRNISDATIIIVGTFILIASFIAYFLFSKVLISLIGFTITIGVSLWRVILLKKSKDQWEQDSFLVIDKIDTRKKKRSHHANKR